MAHLADCCLVLGKLEASPYPAPVEPYDPGLTIYRKKWSNYLPWHAHITALTVAPSARRLGHATRLSEALEQVGDEANAWFVDLFVRVDNEAAIKLYKKMGWVNIGEAYPVILLTGLLDTRSSDESQTTTMMAMMRLT